MSTAPPTTLAPTTAAPSGTSSSIFYPAIAFFGAEPIELEIEILGQQLNVVIDAGPIEVEMEVLGGYVPSITVDAGSIEVTISLHSYGITVGGRKCNWIKWSKIGHLDFTIDESNVAGERPLDWSGCVNEVLKLGNTPVVYGENGVTICNVSGVHYGIRTIHRIGMLNKGTVVGTEDVHYFIDKTKRMYKLSQEGLRLLDYSEFLELLNNPIMTLDVETGIIYICDGVTGFVYSTNSESFGSGPINVTGIGTKSGSLYVVATDEIVVPKFNICTDIYDLGTRKPKTIQWIEVGTELTDTLHAMIEARISNKGGFIKSKWVLVNPSGIAYIPCYGVEFKFHLKSHIYEYLELDYLKVVGVVHGTGYLDSVQ